jgi:hypothetical protein
MHRTSNVKIGKKYCSSVDELHTDNIQHNFLCYVIVALTEVTVVSGEICLDEGLE